MPALPSTRRGLETSDSAPRLACVPTTCREVVARSSVKLAPSLTGFHLLPPCWCEWTCGEGMQDDGPATQQGHHSQLSLTDFPPLVKSKGCQKLAGALIRLFHRLRYRTFHDVRVLRGMKIWCCSILNMPARLSLKVNQSLAAFFLSPVEAVDCTSSSGDGMAHTAALGGSLGQTRFLPTLSGVESAWWIMLAPI